MLIYFIYTVLQCFLLHNIKVLLKLLLEPGEV